MFSGEVISTKLIILDPYWVAVFQALEIMIWFVVQCAHGRPTTAPLVNLVVLHKQIAKLGNWSHGSSGPWHGLSRHKPSLERAAQRLSAGGG